MTVAMEIWEALSEPGPKVLQSSGEYKLALTDTGRRRLNKMLVRSGITPLPYNFPLGEENIVSITNVPSMADYVMSMARYNAGKPLARYSDPEGTHPNLEVSIQMMLQEEIVDVPPMIFDVTRVLDWSNGLFRIGSSCWWTSGGMRGASRQMLVLGNQWGGGFAFRTFAKHRTLYSLSHGNYSKNAWRKKMGDLDVEPRGRSWIYPMENGVVVFNTYDAHAGYLPRTEQMSDQAVASIICGLLEERTGDKWTHKKIPSLAQVGGRGNGGMYINSGTGVMVYRAGDNVSVPREYTLEGTQIYDKHWLMDAFTEKRWTESQWIELPLGWNTYDNPNNPDMLPYVAEDTFVDTLDGFTLPGAMCVMLESGEYVSKHTFANDYHFEDGEAVPGGVRKVKKYKKLKEMWLSDWVSSAKRAGYTKVGSLAKAMSNYQNRFSVAYALRMTVKEYYDVLGILLEHNQIEGEQE